MENRSASTFEIYYWLNKQSRIFSTPFRYTTCNAEDFREVILKCKRHHYDIVGAYSISRTGINEVHTDIVEKLFDIMSRDMETMSYYGDDEGALLAELYTADDDIINTYCDVFEVTAC